MAQTLNFQVQPVYNHEFQDVKRPPVAVHTPAYIGIVIWFRKGSWGDFFMFAKILEISVLFGYVS